MAFYTELDSAPTLNFRVDLVIEGLVGQERMMARNVGEAGWGISYKTNRELSPSPAFRGIGLTQAQILFV